MYIQCPVRTCIQQSIQTLLTLYTMQQHKQQVIMKNIQNCRAITQQTMKKCHNITTTIITKNITPTTINNNIAVYMHVPNNNAATAVRART